MSKVSPGFTWWEYGGESDRPKGASEILDLRQLYDSPLVESDINRIWNENNIIDRRYERVGSAIVRNVILNPRAEAGAIAYADGWGSPNRSPNVIWEAGSIAKFNPDYQVHVLDEIVNFDAKTRHSIDPGFFSVQDSDFRPYARIYGDYFEKLGAYPQVLSGHSLGARAMIALALDNRASSEVAALSTSEPPGAERLIFPWANLGAIRTVLGEAAVVGFSRRLRQEATDPEHFNRASINVLGNFVLDLYEKSEELAETKIGQLAKTVELFISEQYRVVRGLGRAGLMGELINLHLQPEILVRKPKVHYLWQGLGSKTVPADGMIDMYDGLPEEVRRQITLLLSDSSHNSGIAFVEKFGLQTKYVIDQAGV